MREMETQLPTKSIRISGLFTIALFGALGGTINAWLCYAGIPVSTASFKWHVIPAGAFHGAVLAALTVGVAALLIGKALWVRLLAAPLVGWVTAYLSWIPLNRSAFDEPWLKSVSWPFHEEWTATVFGTFVTFGLVALIYYLCLSLGGLFRRGLGSHLLYACAAGILGSLWWWIGWKPWYFSLIHGTIWGMLVGYGTWRAVKAVAPESKDVASQAVGSGRGA
jgi:hypothetical protein